MIRPATYTIFLSRPSDVESDIEIVKDAITDANFLAAPLGVQFATFDWKENATPGLAIEPQARISAQSDGYDVLIGLLGASLGTPTLNHASGSVEEIEGAISRAPNTIFGNDSVLIFFKDVALTLSSDLDEAKKVQELKQGLGPRGILYKSYKTDENLREGILRSIGVLIASHVGILNEKIIPPPASETMDNPQTTEGDDLLELGLMDYSQIASDDIEVATRAAGELGDAMRTLGDLVTEKIPEFTEANAINDTTKVRHVLSEVASAMEDCAKDIQHQGDLMSDKFKGSLGALRNILDIQSVDMSAADSGAERLVAEEVTDGLSLTLVGVISQITDFKEGISTLPRITKELNSAKRKLLISVENLITSLVAIADEVSAINNFARSGSSAQ